MVVLIPREENGLRSSPNKKSVQLRYLLESGDLTEEERLGFFDAALVKAVFFIAATVD